jgi:hypothetical protein
MKKMARPQSSSDGKELAEIIANLLTIAKVAMPPDLFVQDPRIIKAQAMLARLKGELH